MMGRALDEARQALAKSHFPVGGGADGRREDPRERPQGQGLNPPRSCRDGRVPRRVPRRLRPFAARRPVSLHHPRTLHHVLGDATTPADHTVGLRDGGMPTEAAPASRTPPFRLGIGSACCPSVPESVGRRPASSSPGSSPSRRNRSGQRVAPPSSFVRYVRTMAPADHFCPWRSRPSSFTL